jgi:hypothetical protein
MHMMTCKCGATSVTFTRLLEKDFAGGWETDCCLEAASKKADVTSAKEESPTAEVEVKTEAKEEPKKRGRKPKAP